MPPDNFGKLKLYLNRLRKWIYELEQASDTHIRITVRNRYAVKYFEVVYEDAFTEHHSFANDLYQRSKGYNYWMSFWQADVGMGDGSLGEVHEERWHRTEDDLIYRMKRLMSYYV